MVNERVDATEDLVSIKMDHRRWGWEGWRENKEHGVAASMAWARSMHSTRLDSTAT